MLPFADAPDTMIAETVGGVIGTFGGIAALIWLIVIARSGHQDRDDETHARAYFDRHGSWPDEQ